MRFSSAQVLMVELVALEALKHKINHHAASIDEVVDYFGREVVAWSAARAYATTGVLPK